jgi:Mrp family chromosome partitioning ATPase
MRPVPTTVGESVGNGAPSASARPGNGALAVLTSGPPPPNPPAVLATRRIATLLDDLATDYDVVLIDSTPLLPVSDALPLLDLVDGVLLTVRLDYLTRDQARRTANLLERLPHAEVLGLVVTDVPKSDQDDRYGYYAPD